VACLAPTAFGSLSLYSSITITRQTTCVMDDAVRPQQLLASKIAGKLEVARKLLGWIEAEAAGVFRSPGLLLRAHSRWQDRKQDVFTKCSRRSIYAFR
jgi:hypothetical protein